MDCWILTARSRKSSHIWNHSSSRSDPHHRWVMTQLLCYGLVIVCCTLGFNRIQNHFPGFSKRDPKRSPTRLAAGGQEPNTARAVCLSFAPVSAKSLLNLRMFALSIHVWKDNKYFNFNVWPNANWSSYKVNCCDRRVWNMRSARCLRQLC